MKPKFEVLSSSSIKKIINEAYHILSEIGINIYNLNMLQILHDYGFNVDFEKSHVKFNFDKIELLLKSAPKEFKLYDINKNETHDFSQNKIHFTPGSSALNILDPITDNFRKPQTSDYIKYVKIVDQLDYISSQSTAFIPDDVPEKISDSYRLYLSLLYGRKPVITGMFTKESFSVMYNMLEVIRGNNKLLKEYPLTVFTCCPVSPLKWSDVAAQNLYDCAKNSIPIEIVSMPLAGFSSPITMMGTLIQHTAEVLSGVIISQVINPGTPVLFGGAAAIFDMQHQTTPMGAIETMMLACGYNEIGKYLNFPTQAYISISDSKQLDAQAGMETGMGAILAGLSGINEIAGPGMLDFINGFSLEKLVLDNEICGNVLRLTKGIEKTNDFPIVPLIKELIHENHLLTSDHTLKYLSHVQTNSFNIIDRTTLSDWQNSGSFSLKDKIQIQITKLIQNYNETDIAQSIKSELSKLMQSEANRIGMDKLPIR